ncbi:glycosyltransferase family 2 protein [bacterium]|nr:glycosyltransferase family 2 protein [bacterium]
MNISFSILFWLIVFILFYVYIGYPILLGVMLPLKRRGKYTGREFSVSLIITARNEQDIIKEKLINCLELNYPQALLEIIVISDQSTDLTERIVQSFTASNIRLIALPERHGKTSAQNTGVQEANGDIVIFSDANAMYDPDAIRHLVKHFEDNDVGCVSGELCYNNPKNSVVGVEENFYWKYEKWIKKQEDRAGTILGANGSIYSIRKRDYQPLDRDIISDFIEPLVIAGIGKKVVYEPEAKSYENACDEFHEEFLRKRRIVSRSLHGLSKYGWLLNPIKHPRLSFQLISHKLLRWLSPFFMICLFIINVFIAKWASVYSAIFIGQVIFYVLSILGIYYKNKIRLPILFYAPYYFCVINFAALLGFIDFVKGQPAVFWEPVRKT